MQDKESGTFLSEKTVSVSAMASRVNLEHVQCSLVAEVTLCRPQRRHSAEDGQSSTYKVLENLQDVVLTDTTRATRPTLVATLIDTSSCTTHQSMQS